MKKDKKNKSKQNNAYTDFNGALTGNFFGNSALGINGTRKNDIEGVLNNIRPGFITNMWQPLTQLYLTDGIVKNLMFCTWEDALKTNFEIKIEGIDDPEFVKKLERWMSQHDINNKLTHLGGMSSLYGGAGLMVLGNGVANKYFDIKSVNEKTELEFFVADRWELGGQNYDNKELFDRNGVPIDAEKINKTMNETIQSNTFFWRGFGASSGIEVNKSRVFQIHGEFAPNVYRNYFMGWGVSEFERLVGAYRSYIKNIIAIEEFLDEAKLSIFKINNLQSAAVNQTMYQKIINNLAWSAKNKSTTNAMVFDKEDDFEQKQLSLANIESTNEIAMSLLSANSGIPQYRIFGALKGAGFSDNQEVMEVYNGKVERKREMLKPIIKHIAEIGCRNLGLEPESIEIIFKPLRILSTADEQVIKDFSWNVLRDVRDSQAITNKEYIELVNQSNLLPVSLPVNTVLDEVLPVELLSELRFNY